MRLLWAEAEEFLSFKELHLDLASKGLVAVQGCNADSDACDSNGSGKSGLFEVVYWGLYGRTLRVLPSVDGVVRDGAKACCVTVAFETHGKTYQVARTRGRTKSGLVLTAGPEESLTCLDVKDTQAKVEALLGIDADTFQAAVLYGEGELKRFTSSGDADRKRILEALLGTEVYERCLKQASTMLRDAESEEAVAATTAATLDAVIAETKADITDNRKRASSWAAERDARVAKLQAALAALKPQLDEEAHIKGKLPQLDTRLREARSASQKVDKELWEAKSALNRVLAEAGSGLPSLRLRVETVGSVAGALCPTCMQKVPSEYAAGVQSKLRKQITEGEGEVARLEEEGEERLAEYQTRHQTAQSVEQQLTEEASRLRTRCTQLSGVVAQRSRLEAEMAGEVRSVSPYDEALAQTKTRLSDALAKQRDARVKAGEAKARAEDLRFWVAAFGRAGIRSYLLDSVLPALNGRITQISDALTGGEIQIQLGAQTKLKSGEVSDKLAVDVANLYGAKCYGGNSAGEQRRVDLCVLMALHELARSRVGDINVMFLDEVFDILDVQGITRASKFLRSLLGKGGLTSVFVVSHQPELLNLCDARVLVTKRDRCSTVEVE